MSQMLLGHDHGPFVNTHGRVLGKNTQMARETFVTRLATAMTQQGVKGPKQLGDRLKINKQTASKWINGQTTELSADHLYLIADGLKVSARWLWKGEGSMIPRPDMGAEEEKLIGVYRSLPPDWRQEWLEQGQRTAERLGKANPLNPYPRAVKGR